MLGVLCNGVAYLLYFRLGADEGLLRAAVTFLVPVFGILWGRILDEPIGLDTFVGTLWFYRGLC